MTAIEPLDRPASADIETALRQALVSPESTPGSLAPEPTRVLPSMPFRAPSISAAPAGADRTTGDCPDPQGSGSAPPGAARRARPAER